MSLYLCTVWERPRFGDPRPAEVDGHIVEQEIVALNGGKARYRYWLDIREYLGVKLQDIRVKSLRSRKVHIANGWRERLETANAIVQVIARYGRHFLSENSDRREPVDNPFVSRFLVDVNREVWFVDRYSRKHILVRHQEWPGWSDGGTLRGIVQHLAAHIAEGAKINPGYFGPSPQWCCDGDVWGYGADMLKVRDEVAAILGTSGGAE